MPYALVRDLEIYYEFHGPEEGELLFLLNGAYGVIGPDSDWSKQLSRFAEHYRVLTYEHRGHGRTNNPASEFSGYDVLADDAVGLLNHLGIPKIIMVGFSDGAITLLDLAQRYQHMITYLVIVGANFHNDQMCIDALDNLHPDTIAEKYPAWAETLESQHHLGGPGYWKTLATQLRKLWLTQPDFTREDLTRITVPTLVMSGQYDPYGNLNQTLDIHQSIKGSELCIVPGASHPVMSQRPEISTLIILDYLARRRRKATR